MVAVGSRVCPPEGPCAAFIFRGKSSPVNAPAFWKWEKIILKVIQIFGKF